MTVFVIQIIMHFLKKKILNRDLTVLLCFPLLYYSTLEYFLKNHSKDCEERL